MGTISRQGTYNFAILGLGAIIGFIVSAKLLPSLLSTEENGILKLIVTYSLVGGSIFSLGVSSSILKLYPNFLQNNRLSGGVVWPLVFRPLLFFLLFSLTTCIIGPKTAFAPLVSKNSPFLDYAWLLVPASLFYTTYLIGDTILRVFKFTIQGTFLKELLQRVFFLSGALLLLYHFFDSNTYIYWYTISICLPGVIIWHTVLNKKLINWDPSPYKNQPENIKKEFTSLGFYGILTGLALNLVLFLDTLMVEKMMGTSFTGVYAVMGYFGVMVILPSRAIERIAAPIASGLIAEENLSQLKSLYSKSCFSQFLSGSLIAGLILVNLDFIFDFIPKEYSIGKQALIFLAISNLIDASTGINTTIIGVSAYYRYNAAFMVILAMLTIVTNWLLIPAYGVGGAAFATMTSISIFNLLKLSLIRIKFKIQPYNMAFVWSLLIFATAISASWFVGNYAPENKYAKLLLNSSVFLGIMGTQLILKDVRLLLSPFLSQPPK